MRTGRIIAAVTAAAVMGMTMAVTAFAEDEPAGSVAFTAIKSTIGQGFTVEPIIVPFYEGETGIDIVQRAAEIQYTESDYGAYITGFADIDTEAYIPEEISEVCPDMTGRNTEGYLSSFDYTAESGWSYFINGEYASVGIGDYVPADGDVLEFRFTVYGYGADLGIDNSSWGGAAAITEQLDASELIRICAAADDELKETVWYTNGMELLAQYGVTQDEIDTAVGALIEASIMPLSDGITEEGSADADYEEFEDTADSADPTDKGSPDTGVEGLAVVFGAVIIAGGAIAISRKK